MALNQVIDQYRHRNFQLITDNIIKEECVSHLNAFRLCWKEEEQTDNTILYKSDEYNRLLGIQPEEKEEPKITIEEKREEE